MSILDALLDSLPEDRPVREVRVCVHWTAVMVDGPPGEPPLCGLAASLRGDEGPHGHRQVRGAGRLHQLSARELAEYLRSDYLPEASIGMAAVNALIVPDLSRCVELNAGDFLVEKGRDRHVALVGHFPFIPALRRAARRLSVLEQDPGPDEFPAEAAPQVLPQADVVAITGSTLINHTFDELVELCRPDALVMVLGPSTPLSPVLFDHGVVVLSGVQVIDAEAVLRTISQGATFRQVEGVRLLTCVKRET